MSEEDELAITKAMLLGYELQYYGRFGWAAKSPNNNNYLSYYPDGPNKSISWYWETAAAAAQAVIEDANVTKHT